MRAPSSPRAASSPAARPRWVGSTRQHSLPCCTGPASPLHRTAVQHATTPGPLCRCTALFNFRAENPDELSMVAQEEVELVGEGDDEGWVRVRNYKGELGYVPRSYLEVGAGFQHTLERGRRIWGGVGCA